MMVKLSPHPHAGINPRLAILVNLRDAGWPATPDHSPHEGDALAMNPKARPRPLIGQRCKAHEIAYLETLWVGHNWAASRNG